MELISGKAMSWFSKLKTYGGHGNGGKFYMRQMFKESRAISYYGGKINIFGFNVGKDYGYVPEFTLNGSWWDILLVFTVITIGNYLFAYLLSFSWWHSLKDLQAKA